MDLNKIDNLKNMPLIETQLKKSKDGKYIVHKTVITDIKPYNYVDKVMKAELKEASA